MNKLFLTIDVGTQSTRALVFDVDGQLKARAQVPIEPAYLSPHPGWAEQDADAYWRAITTACLQLWDQVDPKGIAGMALTTMRGTVVSTDEGGQPLRPAILWLDQRKCTQPPPMGPLWGMALRAARATDLMAHFQRTAEANWLAQHEPVLWARTSRFLLLSGFLTHKLVGEFVDSVGSQVGFLPFDYKRLQWAHRLSFHWRAVCIGAEQLPRLVEPGKTLGLLTADAAKVLGLPAAVPVIAAAADKACEVLGCGALDGDTGQLSFGTTATINTTQSKYVEVQQGLPAYPAAVPGAYTTEVQIHRGFWMVSWFKREFAHREQALAEQKGVAPESLFDELVRSVPPGSMGLTLQPYWSPGVREPGPEAKGAIIGFGDVHTRAHLYRAILEGIAYGLRGGRDQIERKLGRKLRRFIASGGGSRSDAVMQITADVFGHPIERPSIADTSGLGAAINIAVGLGVYPGYADAVKAMTRIGDVFQPDPAATRTYDALYRDVYRELYPRLRPLYERIRAITGYPE